MKILLTGASGFLGKNILKVLSNDNEIISLGRKNADIIADLSEGIPALKEVEVVIHAAGKAHSLPKNQKEANEFFDVNLKGAVNLLKGLEKLAFLPKSFLYISSVAVYGRESGSLIKENSPLLAIDPYGESKIEAENLIMKWCLNNNVVCSILRLPLIIGSNPKGNLLAMINGIKKGYYFNISKGKARKSMVLAADVAGIIPVLLNKGGVYNLTDGYHPSFSELSDIISKQIGGAKPKNIPLWLGKILALIGDVLGERWPLNTLKLKKIISELTFDDSKARESLKWNPRSVLEDLFIDNKDLKEM